MGKVKLTKKMKEEQKKMFDILIDLWKKWVFLPKDDEIDDTREPQSKVTRVEVIERWVGRHYVNMDTKWVAISLQDWWRTLKVFIEEKE